MNKFQYYLDATSEVGSVDEISSSLAKVSGIPGARITETVIFESGEVGQIISIRPTECEVLVFDLMMPRVGCRVARTGEYLSVPVGEELLGRTIDPIGKVVLGEPVGKDLPHRPVDIDPLGIVCRRRIDQPLVTGVTLVDSLVPLGKGQRELVLGDRKTGKSQFLRKTILWQAQQGMLCIYAAIGKRKTEIKEAYNYFVENKVSKNVVVVATGSHNASAQIYLTPYTAMTIAEYFRDMGRDVLIVLDDMTTHAKYYREMSLVAHKFPGRDSYPGDVFHVHSKLLERAGNFVISSNTTPPSPSYIGGGGPKAGGGMVGKERNVSITCLAAAESVQGDIAGYIQTNLMSMTDGHIFFDSEYFFKGRRPAVNPFLSVTRVGRQTQTPLQKEISHKLITVLSDYENTLRFQKFGAELGENSRDVLLMGENVLQFFNQPLSSQVPVDLQISLFGLLITKNWHGKNIGLAVEKYNQNTAVRVEIAKLLKETKTVDDLVRTILANLNTFRAVMP